MHPDWLGSPQHFAAGVILAATVVFVSPRLSVHSAWVSVGLAVGAVMVAETLVELVEYPLLYSEDPNLTAYFDTLADLANSLAGALVGSGLAVAIGRRRSPPGP
jgi:hypothetical protein